MEDFFVVDIPVFVPEYDKDKKYGWTNYKDELWDLLKETTHGYCMYCYDRIWINQERRGQIEHGIEKKNSMKRLQDFGLPVSALPKWLNQKTFPFYICSSYFSKRSTHLFTFK